MAPSTRSIYSTGIRAYRTFCLHTSLPALPLHELTLQRFVTSLVYRLGYKSIKVYLSGIQYWAILLGDPAHISGMGCLFYLLRGIRRVQGSSFHRSRRLPITIHHLLPVTLSVAVSCLFQL